MRQVEKMSCHHEMEVMPLFNLIPNSFLHFNAAAYRGHVALKEIMQSPPRLKGLCDVNMRRSGLYLMRYLISCKTMYSNGS